ncbi:MAG: hypothetical protein Q8N30_07680 [Methylococcales bacterium]|nr:hypothetical protein [Methylococcales bacterium]
MTVSQHDIVHIADEFKKKKLSKAQKQFNQLIKKIAEQKQLLLEWQTTLPQYNQRLSESYTPLMTKFNQQRIEWLHLLDRAYHNNDFSNADKKKLRHLLGELSHELVVSHGQVEVTDLYNRYAADEQVLLTETVMQDADVDVSFAKKIPKDNAQPDKKTAKQQQEQEKISKSIQSVYRQLVASLHPDREPDEQERERKTKLMQKVNVAYSKKDLLQLLELQLAVEQIDQAHLNNLSEDRLKRFNKVLHEQFTELSEEVEDIELAFKRQMNLAAKVHLSPKYLMKNLDEAMKDLQRSIKGLQMNNKAAKDSAVLKSWLKSYQIPKDALF